MEGCHHASSADCSVGEAYPLTKYMTDKGEMNSIGANEQNV
jgi:hypothetical protein